jgi:F420H(2)-dependent quinone reductase
MGVGMSSARLLNRVARVRGMATRMARLHAFLYRRTGGRFLPRWVGRMPVLAITTTGRKSGRPRTTVVIYMEEGDNLVVVPANAGDDRAPAWWLNLQANREAEVERAGRRQQVRARRATPEEEARLWPKLAERYSGFDEYRGFTDRQLPVVLLEPR